MSLIKMCLVPLATRAHLATPLTLNQRRVHRIHQEIPRPVQIPQQRRATYFSISEGTRDRILLRLQRIRSKLCQLPPDLIRTSAQLRHRTLRNRFRRAGMARLTHAATTVPEHSTKSLKDLANVSRREVIMKFNPVEVMKPHLYHK